MQKSLWALALLLLSPCLQAADLALLLTHDSRSLDADGVVRTQHFQERVVRGANTLWVERVLPQGTPVPAEAHAEPGEHAHLDSDASARWLSRDAQGQLQLRLVDKHSRQIVSVPAGDFDAVGFDGNWDSAWHLLDPRQLKQLQPLARKAPAGSRWFAAQKNGRYLRVLWNETLACPLRVESGTDNGQVQRTLQAELQAVPATRPWLALGGYAHKEYSDFLD